MIRSKYDKKENFGDDPVSAAHPVSKELLQNNMQICVGFLFESADEKS